MFVPIKKIQDFHPEEKNLLTILRCVAKYGFVANTHFVLAAKISLQMHL